MTFVPQYKSLAHLFPSDDGTGPSPVALTMYLFNRDGRCWVGDGNCSRLSTPPHHAVLRRSDVMGWQRERRVLIDTPYNLISVCTAHHETPLEPSKLEVANWMLDQYGEDYIRWLCWLRDTQFKVFPGAMRGWLERNR